MFLYGISYGASNIFIANTSEFRVISGKSFVDVVKTCEYVIGILFSQGIITKHGNNHNYNQLIFIDRYNGA